MRISLCGTKETMMSIAVRKYIRCNGWHKIQLKNITINHDSDLLWTLSAETKNKKCIGSIMPSAGGKDKNAM